MERIGQVSDIWRYPVSSFGGERLGSAELVPAGLGGDRLGAFFEVGTGKIVFPSIVQKWNLAPKIAARTGRDGVEISLDGRLWRPTDHPDLARDLAALTGTAIEYRPYGSDGARQRYAFSPLHLVSLQAMQALQGLLPDSLIDPRRFRPNLVIDLPDPSGLQPEYHLIGREFRIGNLTLRGVRPAGRCSFTTLEQPGLPEDKRVLRELIAGFDKNFGIYAEVVTPGPIAIGDAISADLARPLVIVGGGQAGAMTAKALRDLGDPRPIRILGDEPHPPYERPPLSKGAQDMAYVLPTEDYARLEIDLQTGTSVVRIDRSSREVVTQDGRRQPYLNLILATGGRARGPECRHGRVHRIRSIEDARALHTVLGPGVRLAIFGGGWLGLELAAVARGQGAAVQLHSRGRILGRLPAGVSEYIAARHRAEGVDLDFGPLPDFTERRDAVEVAGHGRFDALVVAIGMDPNDKLAREAGLEIDNGIKADVGGMTSDPAIFALGDVANWAGRRIESWHNANDQAQVVARGLLGIAALPLPQPRFWSQQFDMLIQIAGLPDPAAKPVRSEPGFWDFGSFAIGINRPRDIHRFGAPDDATTEAVDTAPITAQRRALLGRVADFPAGKCHRVELEDPGPVLVVRLEDGFRAADDRCPHVASALSEGFVEGGRIICPVHFAEFDLKSGQPFRAPPGCGRLRCYGIEEVDGLLYLAI